MEICLSKHKKLRQIVIDDKNYRILRNLGFAGQSFNDVITTLLENDKENRENSKKQIESTNVMVPGKVQQKNSIGLPERKTGHIHSSKPGDS